MFASAMENCEAFTLLIAKGADTTIKNCIGFTAHRITESRNQKLEMKHKEANFSKNPPNLLVSGPHMQQPQPSARPYFIISPQPFYQMPGNQLVSQHIRKSSNTISPGFYITSPNVTPITPLNLVSQPQIFFPSEFSPNQVYGANPVPNYYNSNDFLNARVSANNIYLSPIPHATNYSSCV